MRSTVLKYLNKSRDVSSPLPSNCCHRRSAFLKQSVSVCGKGMAVRLVVGRQGQSGWDNLR